MYLSAECDRGENRALTINDGNQINWLGAECVDPAQRRTYVSSGRIAFQNIMRENCMVFHSYVWIECYGETLLSDDASS